MKVKDIKKGFKGTVRALLRSVEENVGKTNSTYVTIAFSDGEGDYKANCFSRSAKDFPPKGTIVDLDVVFKENGYLNIDGFQTAYGADVSEFVPHAPIDINMAMGDIDMAVAKMAVRPELCRVVKYCVDKHRNNLKNWSAAKSYHHNYLGGLLFHIWRMLKSGEQAARIYELDSVLLNAGIILHDIGKLRELAVDGLGTAEYTLEGELFGHLYMGAEMIEEACRALSIDSKCEDIMLLKHMILSHHNKLEYGAVRRPATKEAYVLSMLDDMDAKIWQFENALKDMEPGTTAQVKNLDGVAIYKTL